MRNTAKVAEIKFPRSKNIDINMMPIIMGDARSIPPEYRHYAPLITACNTEQIGKVGYLTVTESTVQINHPAAETAGYEVINTSHRRGGIHTESPGKLTMIEGPPNWGSGSEDDGHDSNGSWGGKPQNEPLPDSGAWGSSKQYRSGGVYMASSVGQSCKVWDIHIDEPGFMGDCEHLRESLGIGFTLEANEIWWMTDRCPHESLPIPAGTHRQYFRLVTNNVSIWFAKHSTPNRLGIEPDCPVTHINKFDVLMQQQKSILLQQSRR